MNKKYYTWQQFNEDSQKIRNQITDQFDCIVGVAKGGICLAGMMSQLMANRNVYLVSYMGGGVGQIIKRLSDIHPDLKNKKILLVDDLSDKGNTLLVVKSDLEDLGNIVNTATLHYKPETKLIPDYFASIETDWIVYPWEKE